MSYIKLSKPGSANMYPEAGINAPKLVRKVIDKFRNLSNEERAKRPLLYYILGSGTPDYKMTKDDSDYVYKTTVEGQTCDNCEFAYQAVVRGNYICSKIAGDIKPKGWCRLWVIGEK